MENKYLDILTQLGLPKNEAQIYETLVQEGELSVGGIANKSLIHRRNVYDSLKRLTEKGLAFEIIDSHENRFQAVDPVKLSEMLAEKMSALDKVLPEMQKLFKNTPQPEAVYIYRGIEGWKNYMRDMVRLGQDNYTIGGKGSWINPKISEFTKQIKKEADKKGMKFYILYDEDSKESCQESINILQPEYRFIPKGFGMQVAMDIYADRSVIFSQLKPGDFDVTASFIVIINQQIADAFRAWFKILWGASIEVMK